MPTVRKLSPEELQEMLEQEQREDLAAQTYGPQLEPPVPQPGERIELLSQPRIGDVVEVVEPTGAYSGIVLRFHGAEGEWRAIQLLVEGKRRWLTNGAITQVLGRPRGISRIDHPARRTYGWYVRLYDRGIPRLARLFSDGQYQGISSSLEAALAFHAAAEDLRNKMAELREGSSPASEG